MEATRPGRAADAIGHIVVHREVMERFPGRVAAILGHFPHIRPTTTPDLSEATLLRHFRDATRGPSGTPVRLPGGETGSGKRVLVLGAIEKERGAVTFPALEGMVCQCSHHVTVVSNGCAEARRCGLLQCSALLDLDPASHIRLNVNYEDMAERMREIAGQRRHNGVATRFDTGGLVAAPGFEAATGFLDFVIPRLEDEAFERSTVVTWSGGGDPRLLLEAATRSPWARQRILPGWIINSTRAQERHDAPTAGTDPQIEAARTLQDAGYTQAIRIDPLIPHDGWKKAYQDLVDTIFGEHSLTPSFVILGSLRCSRKAPLPTPREPRSRHGRLLRRLPGDESDGSAVPRAMRLKMFQAVLDRIRFHNPRQVVGICREDLGTWRALHLDPSRNWVVIPFQYPPTLHSQPAPPSFRFGSLGAGTPRPLGWTKDEPWACVAGGGRDLQKDKGREPARGRGSVAFQLGCRE